MSTNLQRKGGEIVVTQEQLPESDPCITDADLLKLVEAGERDAANEIYRRYAERLMQLANRQASGFVANQVGVEDIVQSVFRTFFRRASEGHYELPEGDELWKLFLVISLNKIRKKSNYWRAGKRNASMTERLYAESYSKDPHSQVDPAAMLEMTIDELVSKLPEDHRGVIRDRIDGYNVNEISERNRLSRRTTERVLQSFRQKLQTELEERDEAQ